MRTQIIICFRLNIILTIYVIIHNQTATLKLRIDIDQTDSNSNIAFNCNNFSIKLINMKNRFI